MYKSEAQAYQAIRRAWKHKRNEAQRAQTLSQWQVDRQEVHPMIRRIVARVMHKDIAYVHMPLDARAAYEARRNRRNVGMYQDFLNVYKVKDNDRS